MLLPLPELLLEEPPPLQLELPSLGNEQELTELELDPELEFDPELEEPDPDPELLSFDPLADPEFELDAELGQLGALG